MECDNDDDWNDDNLDVMLTIQGMAKNMKRRIRVIMMVKNGRLMTMTTMTTTVLTMMGMMLMELTVINCHF